VGVAVGWRGELVGREVCDWRQYDDDNNDITQKMIYIPYL